MPSSSPSLGPVFEAITPRLCVRYLQRYLDVAELLTLSETCWTFFVRCNEEPLWRELCLRPPYIDVQRKLGLFTFRGSWKYTVCAYRAERAGADRQSRRPSTVVLAQSRSIADASLRFNVLLPRIVSYLQASGEMSSDDGGVWMSQLRSPCAAGTGAASEVSVGLDSGRDEGAVESAVGAEMSVKAWQESVLGKPYAPTLAVKYLGLSAGAINYFMHDGTFLRPPLQALRQSQHRLVRPHTEFTDYNWYGTCLLDLVPLPKWCTNAQFFVTLRWKTFCRTRRLQCCGHATAALDDTGGARGPLHLPDELRGVPGVVDRRYRLSVDAFQREYEAPNTPVVLTGCIEDWPARDTWQDIHFFRRFASEALRANGRTADGRRFRMSAADYLAYEVATNAEKPMYVFDKVVLRKSTALRADYAIPPYFTEDFFSYMTEEDRPDYRWLLVGPDGSGSPFHTDPHGTSAWNAVLSGCKRVTLYPPHVVPPGVEEEWIHSDYYASEPCLRWYRTRGDSMPSGSAVCGTFSKEHVGEAYHGSARELLPVEALVFPGDLLFIPSGWWHQVLNIGHTVAVTHNVCSSLTFPRVVADMNAYADRTNIKAIAASAGLHVAKLSLTPIVYTGPTSAGAVPRTVSKQSSLLEPRKKKGMPCYCIEEVDLDIFRGIFIEQWLSGKKHSSCQEALFFCTTCGPPAVQESIKGSSGSGSSSGANRRSTYTAKSCTPEKKSSSAKSTFGSTLKKLFTSSKSSSKADLSTISSKQHSSCHIREPSTRIMSAEEEELPITPRTDKELYLCVTCGSCYCRDHACDHHYSRQQRSTVAGGDDSEAPHKGYPYHSFFIGVPSFVSTHPSHILQETSWGLLFPTVTVREIEEGTIDLSKPLPFYEHFEEICDGGAACETSAFHPNSSMTSNSYSFSRGKNTLGFSSSGMHTRIHSAYSSSGHLDGSLRVHSKSNSYMDKREDRLPARRSALLSPVGAHSSLSLPEFHSSPPENWSYLMFCARCADRQAVRLNGKQCDNDISRHVHLRRLGQLTALLAYFLLRGVRLEVPVQFLEYSAKKHVQQVERQRSQQRAHRLAEMQRVGRASELVGGLEVMGTTGARHTSTTGGGVRMSPTGPNVAGDFSLLSRTETDHVITRAAICGFANESYFCYMNSVLQCLLRCRIFANPLLHLDPSKSPGKLTASVSRLLHHLAHQTYQDVLNGAVFAFVRSLRTQICNINVLFEEDEQQDAQEFLITLLNGIEDEFDKGKSEEEKKASRRVSFEGALLSEVTCSQCKHCVPRNEMFMSLSIPIEKSIEDGIASLFAPTTLRGKDRYACEGCFKKLSQKEQQGHNALAAVQAEAERRAKLDGKKLTQAQIEERVYANALYSEAEVRTSLSHLGGSLAVHLLRFHYDPTAQDFIKVLTPVRISLTLDLTPYVSREVVEAYNRMEKIYLLQRRFPTASEKLISKYLRHAKDDVKLATQKMLDDGHGIAEAVHSRQSSSTAVSRTHTGVGAGNAVGDDASEDVAGVGSVFGDASGCTSGCTSSLAATPLNNPNGDRGTFAKTVAKSWANTNGGAGKATPSDPAAAICAITSDEFDPFGERTPPKPSLVRQLVGIVAHRGSLHGGHYIAYVRHLTRPHVWFRCDDEDIDVVEEKHVLDHEAEVYLAFYE